MPFNGSGVFQRLRSWVSDAASNIRIRADLHDSEDDNFRDGLSNVICKDGQTTITQNIPFNSKRITNLADPVDMQDAVTRSWALNKVGFANISDTPPTGAPSVTPGTIWFDSNSGKLYVFYTDPDASSAQWIQIKGG